jgi:hypothetical protein
VAWSFYNKQNPAEIIDVIITHDLSALTTKQVKVGRIEVPILSKPDLIQMKKDAARPQDLADVQAL